jgi:hypothetical protein
MFIWDLSLTDHIYQRIGNAFYGAISMSAMLPRHVGWHEANGLGAVHLNIAADMQQTQIAAYNDCTLFQCVWTKADFFAIWRSRTAFH